MKPTDLARELGVTASYLHKLVKRHSLKTQERGLPGAERKTYDFPPETACQLREHVDAARRADGGMAARAALEVLAMALHERGGNSLRAWSRLQPDERRAYRAEALRLVEESSAAPLDELRCESES